MTMTYPDAGESMSGELAARRENAGVARAMAIVSSAMEGGACLELERGVAASGVPYILGGWSTGARHELARHAAEFSVTLVFAHRGSCEYVADVSVRVFDDRGDQILKLDEAGPIVLLGLAPGSYQVAVSRNGQTLTRTVAVGPRTRRQTVFYWSGAAAGACASAA